VDRSTHRLKRENKLVGKKKFMLGGGLIVDGDWGE